LGAYFIYYCNTTYAFLTTFDTILLIDDLGSMAGRGWREVSQALVIIVPIVSVYDDDGLDLYFMNHKSTNGGSPNEGIAAGGYRGAGVASGRVAQYPIFMVNVFQADWTKLSTLSH
jgi:hypothetical protein